MRAVNGPDGALVVPIKAFHLAKVRLTGVLDPDERAALARWMAARVLAAGRPMTTYVVCDDDAVARFATSVGAEVLWKPGVGLNGAVQSGVADTFAAGHDHVVVAHSDLPLADDLGIVAGRQAIVLVPDRHGDGTNVIALPRGASFEFRYGAGSFRQHLGAVISSGQRLRVRVDRSLALDVDGPADLRHPLVQQVLAARHQGLGEPSGGPPRRGRRSGSRPSPSPPTTP